MKAIKYKISMGVDDEAQVLSTREVDGFEAFEKFGFKFGVHESTEKGQGTGGDFTCWEITEIGTGFRIPSPTPIFSAQDAITWAQKRLDEVGEAFVIDRINRARAILALSESI